jgi:hypothetical protein
LDLKPPVRIIYRVFEICNRVTPDFFTPAGRFQRGINKIAVFSRQDYIIY